MPKHSHASSLIGNGSNVSGGFDWAYGSNNSGYQYPKDNNVDSYIHTTGGGQGHTHTIGTTSTNSGAPSNNTSGAASGNTAASTAFDSGAASGNTANNTAANASAAHENRPPYMAVAMWERTA